MNFDCKENGGKESFSCKPEVSISSITMWWTWLYCQQQEERWLLRASKFVSFRGWTLIIRKMGEKKAFFANQSVNMVFPNVENMIVVPMTVQVCLISRINFDYKENGQKKSFSSKSKASISCIPTKWTWL